jgi:hypothetical protein
MLNAVLVNGAASAVSSAAMSRFVGPACDDLAVHWIHALVIVALCGIARLGQRTPTVCRLESITSSRSLLPRYMVPSANSSASSLEDEMRASNTVAWTRRGGVPSTIAAANNTHACRWYRRGERAMDTSGGSP